METLQQQKTTQKASYGSRSSVSDAAISHPSRTIVHAKLEMTEPGDHDEQEAEGNNKYRNKFKTSCPPPSPYTTP